MYFSSRRHLFHLVSPSVWPLLSSFLVDLGLYRFSPSNVLLPRWDKIAKPSNSLVTETPRPPRPQGSIVQSREYTTIGKDELILSSDLVSGFKKALGIPPEIRVTNKYTPHIDKNVFHPLILVGLKDDYYYFCWASSSIPKKSIFWDKGNVFKTPFKYGEKKQELSSMLFRLHKDDVLNYLEPSKIDKVHEVRCKSFLDDALLSKNTDLKYFEIDKNGQRVVDVISSVDLKNTVDMSQSTDEILFPDFDFNKSTSDLISTKNTSSTDWKSDE